MAENRTGACRQLLGANGEFNSSGIANLMNGLKREDGISYLVASIMGPQSSGKSTLLNDTFGTNFRVMDAAKGRSQTTKGAWVAICDKIIPPIVLLDLEGTDGETRGQDTAFEKQIALFSLAVSDILVINMPYNAIGLEQAANRPLLKTIFEVNIRLFIPGNNRKTTLMVVIRDYEEVTPLDIVKQQVTNSLEEIWRTVPMPETFTGTPLSKFFRVEVEAFSHYRYERQKFVNQVDRLQQLFSNSRAPGGLSENRQALVPASEFASSAESIWKTIKENEDLDLPAYQEMVATTRCDQIRKEKLSSFTSNKNWLQVEQIVHIEPIRGFGEMVSSLIRTTLAEYDQGVEFFDADVKTAKRIELTVQLLQCVEPAYRSLLEHFIERILGEFIEEFGGKAEKLNKEQLSSAAEPYIKNCLKMFDGRCRDAEVEQANWETSTEKDVLQNKIGVFVAKLYTKKLEEDNTMLRGILAGVVTVAVSFISGIGAYKRIK